MYDGVIKQKHVIAIAQPFIHNVSITFWPLVAENQYPASAKPLLCVSLVCTIHVVPVKNSKQKLLATNVIIRCEMVRLHRLLGHWGSFYKVRRQHIPTDPLFCYLSFTVWTNMLAMRVQQQCPLKQWSKGSNTISIDLRKQTMLINSVKANLPHAWHTVFHFDKS